MSFFQAEISALLSGNTEITTRTVHCSTRCCADTERKGEARKPTSIYLPHFFLAILYPFGRDQSFFCVLLTAACNLLKNWGFSAQVCISAFGLSAGTIALFSVLLRLSFVFLLHAVSLVFMSLYWYAYLFELLLVFTPLCKHAERINIRFQPLVSLWCSHNTQPLRLTPLQWLAWERLTVW